MAGAASPPTTSPDEHDHGHGDPLTIGRARLLGHADNLLRLHRLLLIHAGIDTTTISGWGHCGCCGLHVPLRFRAPAAAFPVFERLFSRQTAQNQRTPVDTPAGR